jgi:hypothetical protein
MTMMVRLMSVLPFATGSVCLLLVLVSMFGFTSGTIEDEIPAIPCIGMDVEDCATGMSEADLDVPTAFFLLSVDLEISTALEDDAWIGVVDAEWAETCPPDETGLTECTAGEYTFLSGGPGIDGPVKHTLDPGSVRFVTGGDEGAATLQDNIVTTHYSVHLAGWFSVILALAGFGLCASGLHMAFPMVGKARKE